MNSTQERDEEELRSLRSQRSRQIWFTKHPDEIALRRIDKRIKELEKKTRMQT